MKIALMLLVTVLMMMCQTDSKDIKKVKIKYNRDGTIRKIKVRYGWWKRDVDNADAIQEREILSPRIDTRQWWSRRYWRWGKREVRDADFDAAYNAAAEDGVFTDKEIKSVFGVDENGLPEFKATFDVNGDGVIQVEEYEMVKTISSKDNQDG